MTKRQIKLGGGRTQSQRDAGEGEQLLVSPADVLVRAREGLCLGVVWDQGERSFRFCRVSRTTAHVDSRGTLLCSTLESTGFCLRHQQQQNRALDWTRLRQ